MKAKYALLLLFCVLLTLNTFSRESSKQMLRPAISPDGKTIAFVYEGDIFTVPSAGGIAVPLTNHPACESHPVWSPDSRKVAFASDRNGNFDIFIIDAQGGEERQLTFQSPNQYPESFTQNGKYITISENSVYIPTEERTSTFSPARIYQVAILGGDIKELKDLPVRTKIQSDLSRNDQDYQKEEEKETLSSPTTEGMEICNANNYQSFPPFGCNKHCPVLSSDGSEVYFLCEESGTFNVFRFPISNPKDLKQVTCFDSHPVHSLTLARGDILCFGRQGKIFTKRKGMPIHEVSIVIYEGMEIACNFENRPRVTDQRQQKPVYLILKDLSTK